MEKIGYSSVESKDSEEILSLKEIREKLKNLKEDVLKKKLSKKEEEGKMEKQMVMGKVLTGEIGRLLFNFYNSEFSKNKIF